MFPWEYRTPKGKIAKLRKAQAEAKRKARPKKAKRPGPPRPRKLAGGRQKFTTLDDGDRSVRTVSGGGFETNRRRH